MKHFYGVVTILLFALACLLWIENTTRYNEFTQKVETELMVKDLRIEQLEKEIRIMKTDLDIKENGFEK